MDETWVFIDDGRMDRPIDKIQTDEDDTDCR